MDPLGKFWGQKFLLSGTRKVIRRDICRAFPLKKTPLLRIIGLIRGNTAGRREDLFGPSR